MSHVQVLLGCWLCEQLRTIGAFTDIFSLAVGHLNDLIPLSWLLSWIQPVFQVKSVHGARIVANRDGMKTVSLIMSLNYQFLRQYA
jgi:hypothetical protein